jgi:hypothetical protein
LKAETDMEALTRSLIYLACTTIYDFFLLNVEYGGIYLLCHPRNLRVVFAASIPQNVISERAGVLAFWRSGVLAFRFGMCRS